MLSPLKLLLCVLFNAVTFVSAAEYEVDGRIEQTLFKADCSVQLVMTNLFTVFVKDCSWLIHIANYDKAGKPSNLNETTSLNGGLIYTASKGIGVEPVHNSVSVASPKNVAFIYSTPTSASGVMN